MSNPSGNNYHNFSHSSHHLCAFAVLSVGRLQILSEHASQIKIIQFRIPALSSAQITSTLKLKLNAGKFVPKGLAVCWILKTQVMHQFQQALTSKCLNYFKTPGTSLSSIIYTLTSHFIRCSLLVLGWIPSYLQN